MRTLGDRTKKLRIAFHFARTGGWANERYECGACRRHGWHAGRNCAKHFPALVDPARPPCWHAEYRTGKGEAYSVDGTEVNECPVSLITPRSLELVQIFARARYVADEGGAALFGPDISRWPIWAVDATVVIEQERAKEQAARFEAESRA